MEASCHPQPPPMQRSIFKPPDGSILLDHEFSPKTKYKDRSAKEMERAVFSPDLKCLVNDVQFLTEKSRDGDTVIYVGNNTGPWLPMAARMFPGLQFLVYDGNAAKLNKEIEDGTMPENVHLKTSWFSELEAEKFAKLGQAYFDPMKTLLMAETSNLSYSKDGSEPIFRDLDKDLGNQDAWMHLLKPRSAMLKFCIPYHGGKQYSYLQGKLHLEPFGPKTSTDVRLVVDTDRRKINASGGCYPRQIYNAAVHDECMFHHNSFTRLQHMDSDCKIKVSWDQHASHNVLEKWADRALLDESVSGIRLACLAGESGGDARSGQPNASKNRALVNMRKAFVKERINALDLHFGRTLGCRMSSILVNYVDGDNHVKRNEMGWIKVRGRWKVRRPVGAAGASADPMEEEEGGVDE